MRGGDQLAGNRSGESAAISAMFDENGEGDALLGVIRRETREPGMSKVFFRSRAGTLVDLCGARFSGNRDARSGEEFASGAGGDYRAHGLRENERGAGGENGIARSGGLIAGSGYQASF